MSTQPYDYEQLKFICLERVQTMLQGFKDIFHSLSIVDYTFAGYPFVVMPILDSNKLNVVILNWDPYVDEETTKLIHELVSADKQVLLLIQKLGENT